jgi:hypothetical protein
MRRQEAGETPGGGSHIRITISETWSKLLTYTTDVAENRGRSENVVVTRRSVRSKQKNKNLLRARYVRPSVTFYQRLNCSSGFN